MPKDSAVQRKFQRIAETCARRMAQQNWRDRRHTIEAALQSVGQDIGALAAGPMVASILRQLDISTVVDNDQALILAMSDSADHQIAACDWFIDQSLETLAAPASHPLGNEKFSATIH